MFWPFQIKGNLDSEVSADSKVLLVKQVLLAKKVNVVCEECMVKEDQEDKLVLMDPLVIQVKSDQVVFLDYLVNKAARASMVTMENQAKLVDKVIEECAVFLVALEIKARLDRWECKVNKVSMVILVCLVNQATLVFPVRLVETERLVKEKSEIRDSQVKTVKQVMLVKLAPQVDLVYVVRMEKMDYLVILSKEKMGSLAILVNKGMLVFPDLLVSQALQDNIFALGVHAQHQSLVPRDLMVIKALMVTKAILVVLVFVDDLVHQVRMQLHVIVQKLLGQKGMMVYLVKTVRKVPLVCLVYLVRTEHVVLKGHLVIKVFLVNLEELVVLV